MTPVFTVPNSSWSLTKLTSYCQETSKRTGFDAWCMGKAILCAKEKVPEGEITAWKREAFPGLSPATISRYERVAGSVEDGESIIGIKLNQLYELTGIADNGRKKSKKKSASKDKSGGKQETDLTEGAQEASESDQPVICDLNLVFLASKLDEVLVKAEALPVRKRWKDLDVDEVRICLTRLSARIASALESLPSIKKLAA